MLRADVVAMLGSVRIYTGLEKGNAEREVQSFNLTFPQAQFT
jgi:hypothetical protein